MKKTYHLAEDLFIAMAFVSFIVAVVTGLLEISPILWGITPLQLFKGAGACLLFSIALSLREIALARK